MRVDQRAQRLRVREGSDTTDRVAGGGAHGIGIGALDGLGGQRRGDLGEVHLMVAAGQHEDGGAVGGEDKRLDDGPHRDAKGAGRLLCGVGGVLQPPNLAGRSRIAQCPRDALLARVRLPWVRRHRVEPRAPICRARGPQVSRTT